MQIINSFFGTRVSIYTPAMWIWFISACYVALNLKNIPIVNDNFWSFCALYVIVTILLTNIENRIQDAAQPQHG